MSHPRILPGHGTQSHQQFGPDRGGWCPQSQSQWSCGPVEEKERRLFQARGRAHLLWARTGVVFRIRRGRGWPQRWWVGNGFIHKLDNKKTPIINMHNNVCMALIQVAGHCRWSSSVLHEGWRCWGSRFRLHEPRRTLGRSDARPGEWHQRLDVWTGGGEHWRCQSRLIWR